MRAMGMRETTISLKQDLGLGRDLRLRYVPAQFDERRSILFSIAILSELEKGEHDKDITPFSIRWLMSAEASTRKMTLGTPRIADSSHGSSVGVRHRWMAPLLITAGNPIYILGELLGFEPAYGRTLIHHVTFEDGTE